MQVQKYLVGAMTRAGLSGRIHIVDAFIKRSRPPAIDAIFVGALAGLQKDIIDYVIGVADRDGLDKCLLMSAARIWSCRTLEEVRFLADAIQSLADAGAESFQQALQVSCGDAVIEHWNGDIFVEKSKILQRLLVLGTNYMTPDFFGRILLMICVTFLYKLFKYKEKVRQGSLGLTKLHCKSGKNLCCATIVQDMFKVLSVVCKHGAADVISSRLLDIADRSLEDIGRLLHISNVSIEASSAEWPLKAIKFLLIDCGIKDLSVTVTALAAFQAARLNVLLSVVQCFLKLQCFEAVYVYLNLSITFCRMDAIQYLLSVIHQSSDTRSLIHVVRQAASDTGGPPLGPQGVLCALHSNFLMNKDFTMNEAVTLAKLPETDPSVKTALRTEWSQEAFEAGKQAGERHFFSVMLVRKHAKSPLRVGELPLDLQVAIGYLPLYKDCSNTPGSLLSLRQRGELLAALRQLYQGSRNPTYSESAFLNADKQTLLSRLAARLPAWVSGGDLRRCNSY